jgi:hypothetical protein
MNVAARTLVATGAAAGILARSLQFVVESWRRITLKQVLVVNLIAVLISVWDVLTWFRMSLAAAWQTLAWIFADNAMVAMGLLLVVAIADRVVPRRWPWWAPYAVAALGGGVLVNLLASWCFQYVIPLATMTNQYVKPEYLHRMRTLTELADGVVTGGIAIFVYAWLRRLRQQQDRLHEVQQAQVSARRRLSEARLQTMQARVEPELLVDTLGQIEALHATDATRALHTLDALIVYLRKAVPREHAHPPTLAGEIALVGAWLDVVRGAQGDVARLEVSVPAAAGAATFPALVLPCLVRHEIAGMPRSPGSGSLLRIAADVAESRLRVHVVAVAAHASEHSDDRIESLRARLAALYGDRAHFLRRRCVQGDRCEVDTTIEIPQWMPPPP